MRFLIGLWLLILSVPSVAVPLNGLYRASVLVEDQSQTVRNAAISEALKKVVQKVSGRRSVLDNVALQAALSNVGSYVEQFQYTVLEDGQVPYRLIVSFQKSALDTVLQQFEVPVWGKNRPEMLFWLAIDEGDKRYILSDGPTKLLLMQAAEEAGLTVTLPLLDLDDQRAIRFKDIWAGFPEQILAASQRYSVKQVMHGRLLKISKGHWRLSGSLLNIAEQYEKVNLEGSIEKVLADFFAQNAERLANIYAPSGLTKQTKLKLHIKGLRDLATVVKVTDYLSSLDRVKTLTWNALTDGQLKLLLTIAGEVSVLEEIIALNNVLLPDSAVLGKPEPLATSVPLEMTPRVHESLYYRVN